MGTVKHQHPADVEAIYAKLIDPDHMRRRSEDAGEKNVEARVEEKGGATIFTIIRDIESDIPSFAKKVVDPVNRVESVFTWRADGHGRRATYHAKVSSRITVDGTLTLTPRGEGCEHVETFEAQVSVPLVGKKIAKIVEQKTGEAVAEACRFTSAND